MKVLDLYCGAGGAGAGYHSLGFDVVGVDLGRQPDYPFAFLQHDALKLDIRFLRSFQLIHASPPCQAHTSLKHAPNGREHLDLIPATRAMLKAAGVPYVIENVVGAPLINPVTLCGTMFGLGVSDNGTWHELHRHRIFEASFPLVVEPCKHSGGPVIGVYGGHARRRSAVHGGRGTRDVWQNGHKGAAAAAMDMPWATLGGMSQAIPPAYTAYIGARFRRWALGRAA